jgi:hypothetical protein
MFTSNRIKSVQYESFVFLALGFFLTFYSTSFAADRNISLPSPQDGASYVIFDKFAAVEDITIDNSLAKVELIVIQLKDFDGQELKSRVRILGSKAKIIMVSSKSIAIDGAKFSNSYGVELIIDGRDQIEQSVSKSEIGKSEQVAESKIIIGSHGVDVESAPLFARAARIEVKGEVRAERLVLEAYGDVSDKTAAVDHILDIEGMLQLQR